MHFQEYFKYLVLTINITSTYWKRPCWTVLVKAWNSLLMMGSLFNFLSQSY